MGSLGIYVNASYVIDQAMMKFTHGSCKANMSSTKVRRTDSIIVSSDGSLLTSVSFPTSKSAPISSSALFRFPLSKSSLLLLINEELGGCGLMPHVHAMHRFRQSERLLSLGGGIQGMERAAETSLPSEHGFAIHVSKDRPLP